MGYMRRRSDFCACSDLVVVNGAENGGMSDLGMMGFGLSISSMAPAKSRGRVMPGGGPSRAATQPTFSVSGGMRSMPTAHRPPMRRQV
jgi:hypothetical protein